MKKKKRVEIKINLSNKLFYFLIAIVILIIVGVGVYAYNSGGPANFIGHSSDELEVEWEDINNVPSGFADGIDDGGQGALSGWCREYGYSMVCTSSYPALSPASCVSSKCSCPSGHTLTITGYYTGAGNIVFYSCYKN